MKIDMFLKYIMPYWMEAEANGWRRTNVGLRAYAALCEAGLKQKWAM